MIETVPAETTPTTVTSKTVDDWEATVVPVAPVVPAARDTRAGAKPVTGSLNVTRNTIGSTAVGDTWPGARVIVPVGFTLSVHAGGGARVSQEHGGGRQHRASHEQEHAPKVTLSSEPADASALRAWSPMPLPLGFTWMSTTPLLVMPCTLKV